MGIYYEIVERRRSLVEESDGAVRDGGGHGRLQDSTMEDGSGRGERGEEVDRNERTPLLRQEG